MIYALKNLIAASNTVQANINGKWVPCRPLPGPISWRIRAAWLVLTGKADAVIWPENQ